MHYRMTVVGFYDAMGSVSVEFILNQTEMQTIICSGEYIKRIVDMRKDGMAGHIKALVTMDDIPAELIEQASQLEVTIHTYASLIEAGENAKDTAPEFTRPTKDDFYMFSYTSGTTGDSKGVMLTHNNIMSQAYCTKNRTNQGRGDAYMSYLPYPHSYEQILTAASLMSMGRVGYYQGDPLKIVEDAAKLQPAFFPSVPRLYNRIYGKIKAGVDAATGCKKWLVGKAIATKVAGLERNGTITHGCYDKLVFGKMAKLLGGRVKLMTTGSAPIDKSVLDFLKICFSCPIIEGYGLTETATGGATTSMDDKVTGHVGGPSEAVKLRLKDLPEMEYLSTDKPYPRGEICMKGPCVFSGYYKRQDKTDEAFDEEMWFKTGDVGMVYPNGSIKIIDRSKNIFKLSQGEYIAPEKLENIFVLSPFIAQSMVYGDSIKSCLVAIVVVDEIAAKKWCDDNGKADVGEACASEDYNKVILDDMARLCKENNCTGLERPKKIYLTSDPFSIENDMLTPTFKLKRNIAK